MPPPSLPAVLPLMVTRSSVTVPPSLVRPAPQFAATLLLIVVSTALSVPRL